MQSREFLTGVSLAFLVAGCTKEKEDEKQGDTAELSYITTLPLRMYERDGQTETSLEEYFNASANRDEEGNVQPLLVNGWATWCPPCWYEIPILDQELSSRVHILGALYATDDLEESVADYGPDYQNLQDSYYDTFGEEISYESKFVLATDNLNFMNTYLREEPENTITVPWFVLL